MIDRGKEKSKVGLTDLEMLSQRNGVLVSESDCYWQDGAGRTYCPFTELRLSMQARLTRIDVHA